MGCTFGAVHCIIKRLELEKRTQVNEDGRKRENIEPKQKDEINFFFSIPA